MPRGQYERRSADDSAFSAEVEAPVSQSVSRRADETRRERRRRDDGDMDGMAHLKLAIPREIQEQGAREGKVFRYFLETNVPGAYANDWDKVEGAADVLANPMAGEQARLVLCSKYKDWHDADQRKDEQMLSDREDALMQGHVPGVSDSGQSGAGLVVPHGAKNRLTRQRGL